MASFSLITVVPFCIGALPRGLLLWAAWRPSTGEVAVQPDVCVLVQLEEIALFIQREGGGTGPSCRRAGRQVGADHGSPAGFGRSRPPTPSSSRWRGPH